MIDLNHSKILLVEDNPRYLELLKESLQEQGYQNIEQAENPQQAIEMLSTCYFDVIVADMSLGDEKKGGLSILQEVKQRNITSIVIILTANDNWLDCRSSFLQGARDYLSKNMRGDVFEILHESISDALEYAKRYGNRSDELWIQTHKEELLKQYPNQHIAVMNNSVIDCDINEEALRQRILERKLPLLVPVIQYMNVESFDKLPISEVIKRGENNQIEFKQTFQCDAQTNNKNEAVQHSSLKTIAAFLNSEGGILLIGVEDNGDIFGLESDYKLLGKRQNWDGFYQKLSAQIIESIGTEFIQYLSIEPCELENKEIAVIRVSPAHAPAFLQTPKDKNGISLKNFYIRAGNTTRALDMEELYLYLRSKIKWVLN